MLNCCVIQLQVVTSSQGQLATNQVLPPGVKLEVMGSHNPLVVTSTGKALRTLVTSRREFGTFGTLK